jgi:L-ribulose-5-phosphate 4-epimerase
VVIKPSGVPYQEMRPEHLVVTDLDGKTVEGILRPSSDLATHLVLYGAFPSISGVAHTHSERDRLGTGASPDSLLWHHARRPLLRGFACH